MPFIRGLDLSRMLYEEEIGPILAKRYPGIEYAAATLGMCSEVLGLDDEVSMDHEWGPRLSLFLAEDDYARYSVELPAILEESLPSRFKGLRMAWRSPGLDVHDTRECVLYHVSVRTVSCALDFCSGLASFPLQDVDWLRISEQHLLEFTSGEVYRDDLGDLVRARESLRYYPDNVLRFLLMHEWGAVNADWWPIGRMGSRGDVLGVSLQAARVAQHLMRITFMLNRRYIPYSKWFGTLFSALPEAPTLRPILQGLLKEEIWQKAEESICAAASVLLERQNAMGLAMAVPVEPIAMDDGRHHQRGGFREAWSALSDSVNPPLDAVMNDQVSWLDDRSLILANGEIGKWSLFLRK